MRSRRSPKEGRWRIYLRQGRRYPPPRRVHEFPDFVPVREHLLMKGVYVEYPHHINGSLLDRGVLYDAVWELQWRRLAPQLTSWYATPSGSVGSWFKTILDAEWQSVISRSWNSRRPLVLVHVFLTKTLVIRRSRGIRVRFNRRIDLWYRGLHTGLLGELEAKGAAREGRDSSRGEE